MAKRSSLRASDADRERIAERLREAAGEGRILAHELEERLATALRAKTYGELDDVIADLPGSAAAPRPRSRKRRMVRQHPELAVAALVAVTLVVCLLAMVAVAVSGVLIPLIIVAMVLRGGHHGRIGGGGRGGRHARRGRHAYTHVSRAGGHVHVHVHRDSL